MYRFEASKHPYLAEAFLQDPDHAENDFENEQAFMTHVVKPENVTWWDDAWVKSYRRHCVPIFPRNLWQTPTIPQGCKIVIFHGHPNQDGAINGWRRKFRRQAKPMPELKKYWY